MRWLVACLTLVAASAHADKRRADQLFDDGRRYLATHEYALACTAFEQSQQADPALGTQLNIALCYEQWGPEHVVAAYRAYQEAERLASVKHDARGQAAHRKVEELGPKVPHLTVSIPANVDANAVFVMDGKETFRATLTQDMLVEPGVHKIEVRVPGAPPKIQTVTLKEGAHETVVVDAPAAVVVQPVVVIAPRNKTKFYGGIALASAGGIALGAASYIAVIARSDYNDAIASCPSSTCTTRASFNATQNAISHANDATILGVAGVAMAAAGVYLIMTSRGEVQAAPMVAPNTVGLTIGGRL